MNLNTPSPPPWFTDANRRTPPIWRYTFSKVSGGPRYLDLLRRHHDSSNHGSLQDNI